MNQNERNADLRSAREEGKVPNWMIAERLGVSEQTLIRWFRFEMPDSKKAQIMSVINEIKEERERVAQ